MGTTGTVVMWLGTAAMLQAKAARTAKTRPDGDAALTTTVAVLDRTASKGIIKRETASRHKSRLAKHVAKLPA